LCGSLPDVGNREDLLVGAKRCLLEKGYARTTARDIATAAGVSLAAIGYHYGSKEALLNLALIEATGEWGQALEAMLADIDPGEDRFEAVWTKVIESFTEHRRLWVASFEVLGQIEHVPQVREHLAAGLRQAFPGLGRLFHDPEADERQATAVGAFYQALLTGVMAQLLIDPEHASTPASLSEALRAIAR
jgi:AcrR family transcriptional regulator